MVNVKWSGTNKKNCIKNTKTNKLKQSISKKKNISPTSLTAQKDQQGKLTWKKQKKFFCKKNSKFNSGSFLNGFCLDYCEAKYF